MIQPYSNTSVAAGLLTGLAVNEHVLARAEEVVGNAMLMRSELLRKLLDPRRDIDDECGYPTMRGSYINPTVYQQLWERECIANRVVGVLPKETWQVQPQVYETDDAEVNTPFEEKWDRLAQDLRGGHSFYQEEEGSPIWESLRRLDVICGIGQYGVLLIGIDDGLDPGEEAKVAPIGTERKLLYLRSFQEAHAQITRMETDPNHPRYGMPTEYLLTLYDPRNEYTPLGVVSGTMKVHWTRVLHVADNLESNEVFGAPRMRPVLNRLLDLRKLYSGSAEMYWRGAFPGISLETNPAMGGDVRVDTAAIRDQMEQYMNGLQRYLLATGLTAKTLSPTVVSPTDQIKVQIEALCIQLGIPVRIFMGSERGELASSQDDAAWNDRLKQRQREFVTPRIIVPFVDRLIALGCLPRPSRFGVYWPDLTSQNEQEKAQVAATVTQALGAYVSSDLQQLITPVDYLTKVLKWDDHEVQHLVAKAEEEEEPEEVPEQLQAFQPQPGVQPQQLQQAQQQRQALPQPVAQPVQQPVAVPQPAGAGK